jgi:hypothetical protein
VSSFATPTLYVLSADLLAEVGLRVSLVLEIDHDAESGFVARVLSPAGLGSFGVGATPLDAVRDLVEVMREEAEALRARQASLGVEMARELALLDTVLVPAHGVAATAYVVAPMASGATGPTYAAPAGRNSYLPSSAVPTY